LAVVERCGCCGEVEVWHAGFVGVLVNLERPGILLWHFSELERSGKGLLVMESAEILLKAS